MKLLPLLLIVVLPTIQAAEVVTLNTQNPSVALNESDVIQVLSVIPSDTAGHLVLNMPGLSGGARPSLYIDTRNNQPDPTSKNATFTGATRAALTTGPGADNPLPGNAGIAVTLRITRAADETFSDPVIMPAITDGNYTVELETSTDLTNWIPAVPGDYLGSATNRFFRVKVAAKAD